VVTMIPTPTPHKYARRRRGGNVGIRPSFAGFSKPGGKVGNLFFEFSTLSTGRHFHGARRGVRAQRRCHSLRRAFAHGLAPHLDAVSIVHQPGRDASAKVGSPICSATWRPAVGCQDHRAPLVAVFTDFQKVPTLGIARGAMTRRRPPGLPAGPTGRTRSADCRRRGPTPGRETVGSVRIPKP